MSQRIYRVGFEIFEGGAWVGNAFSRDVAVIGGAEQAIKVALQRQKRERESGASRSRVEDVRLLASED